MSTDTYSCVLYLGTKAIYKSHHPLILFFYQTCRDFGELPHEAAVYRAELGWQLYLKDSNDTPVGKLADWLAKVDIGSITDHHVSRTDMLDKFYAWQNGDDV